MVEDGFVGRSGMPGERERWGETVRAIRQLASSEDPNSLGNRLRGRRFRLFEQMISEVRRPIRIIDIGGTTQFWEYRGWAGRDDVHITLVNLTAEDQVFDNIESHAGDATRLDRYADGEFDVAFSNSTIEHLFTLENQRAMAREIRRVARTYWVQTPNFWFPMEPHFHVPGWQWLPVGVRLAVIRRRRCGWRGPCPDLEKAKLLVGEIRLMTRRELVDAFPGGRLHAERFFGLIKSWVVLGGFAKH
jgi:hypothetical protein